MIIDKKTKIIATIGPSSDTREIILRLIDAGMNVARLNFSHGNHETHQEKINILQKLIKEGHNISIMLDTKGPEIRSGDFLNDEAYFHEGDIVEISMIPQLGTSKKFSISYPGLIHDIEIGNLIRFDDGKISFKVLEKDYQQQILKCQALNSHTIKSRRNCIAPFARISAPFISNSDYDDIVFGCQNNINYIAASFTRRKQDILDIKRILKQENKEFIQIIAKIENQEGVDNIDEILEVCDGVMVARGDLGVEIPPEDVPVVQRMLINKCRRIGKPVIVATQMLDSMQKNPNPTRAEVSDVANAIFEVCDAIMLSGESASGDYPVESVMMEAKIARRIESILEYHKLAEEAFATSTQANNDAIAFSVANSAIITSSKVIIAFSESGATSKRIAKYRPKCPIISVSTNTRKAKELCLNWGVYGVTMEAIQTGRDELDKQAMNIAKNIGLKKGDTFLLTGGNGFGSTNFMKILVVE